MNDVVVAGTVVPGVVRVKVHVDQERCEGHGRCYATAPAVFQPDEIGNGHEIGDGTVTAEHERRARIAVANCPEMAITIDEGS